MNPIASISTRQPARTLRLGVLWIPLLFAMLAARAADGALDDSFNPPREAERWIHGMAAIGGRLHVADPVHGIVRLLDDGSEDESWRLAAPLTPPAAALARTPFGDWVAVDLLGRAFLERPDGVWTSLPGALSLHPSLWPVSLLPGPGDSVIVGGRTRFGADGRRQPAFAYHQNLVAANFDDAPRLLAGSLNVSAVQDRQGRLILGGTFRQAGGAERPGLARFLPNGRLDPDWNPGPALGIAVVATNTLTRVPYRLVPGPDDSVWVSLWVANPGVPGASVLRLARVSSDGAIAADFPCDAFGGDPSPIAQPDGRLLVMGRFDRWGGVPASGIVRLHPDGTVDPSFEVVLTGSPAIITSAAADDSGRLWFAGFFDSVNGVQRPGLARVFAWTPEPAAPEIQIETAAPRLATNEVLLLRARVTGIPPPDLQWFQNGEAIPGATNRGLRLAADQIQSPAQFRLVASNASGQRELEFPPVSFAVRSPVPGRLDSGFDRRFTRLAGITQIVPLPDGTLLVGAGRWEPTGPAGPRVARLLPDGSLDPSFGNQGVVSGLGTVEGLLPADDGGLLVFGQLTELAGQPVSGIGQLDRHGRFVPRDFPPLDIPHVSAVLPLNGGGMVWAGRFTRVGTQPAFRLARLDPGLNPAPAFSSPLERWQFVDMLGLDAGGRLLIAGSRIYTDVVLTNAPHTGLQRLLDDGRPDPGFRRFEGPVRSFFVEPGGTLLVGMPAYRLSPEGELLAAFPTRGLTGNFLFVARSFQPDHRMVRTPDGGVVFPAEYSGAAVLRETGILRWRPDGDRDFNFELALGTTPFAPDVHAAALLSDGSVVLAAQESQPAATPGQLETFVRLMKIRPDADHFLTNPRVTGNRFEADLAAQPGAWYGIFRRSSLSGPKHPMPPLEGDGYIQTISDDASGDGGFLQVERQR